MPKCVSALAAAPRGAAAWRSGGRGPALTALPAPFPPQAAEISVGAIPSGWDPKRPRISAILRAARGPDEGTGQSFGRGGAGAGTSGWDAERFGFEVRHSAPSAVGTAARSAGGYCWTGARHVSSSGGRPVPLGFCMHSSVTKQAIQCERAIPADGRVLGPHFGGAQHACASRRAGLARRFVSQWHASIRNPSVST